jgi:hypothetical protein
VVTLDELVARTEINDALVRYCRGIDRRDRSLIESAYFPDAVDHRPYGPEGRLSADPKALAERAVTGFGATPEFSQHHLTNVSIELDLAQGRAAVETYVIALHPVSPSTTGSFQPATRPRLHVVGGRYLDRFERRAGEWRIAERTLVVDWSREHLEGEPLFGAMPPGFRPGAADDPSHAHLGHAG